MPRRADLGRVSRSSGIRPKRIAAPTWADEIFGTGNARDADYYQILAYTRALDVPAGMLIYCQRDGDAPPRAITVGAHQTRLDTWALTLSGSPADIERRLRDLADQIIERAAA